MAIREPATFEATITPPPAPAPPRQAARLALLAPEDRPLVMELRGRRPVGATSEKIAYAHSFGGKVPLIIDTHTHCRAADHQILLGGTGYISDGHVRRLRQRYRHGEGWRGTASGVRCQANGCRLPREHRRFAAFAETDDSTGLARRIQPVRDRGWWSEVMPRFEGARRFRTCR